MVEIRELTKVYGGVRAIDRLSFSVKKGEVVGFLGPNGAGKTTTMKIITGFMAPTEGSVSVGGYDVLENPIEVKRRIGFLPETPPVYGEMSVEQYLKFVAKLKGVESAKLTQSVERAIERTELGQVRKRLIQNLSKGYRQRVGISQALVSDPEVLILDEPTVGLDPRQVAEVRSLIKELAGSHTVILSTHILPEVQATCERIIIINKGKIVAQDSIEAIGRKMASQGAVRVHLKVSEVSQKLQDEIKSIAGVKAIEKTSAQTLEIETDGTSGIAQAVAAKVVGANVGLLELREENANLEDVFLKLTTSEETQTPGAQP